MNEESLPNPYSALERFGVQTPDAVLIRSAIPTRRWPLVLDPIAWIALAGIYVYRLLIPVSRRRQCIYTPSCSQFGLEAIRKYHGWRGVLLTAQRIGRCNGAKYRGGLDLP